jgi:hypothetical protein
MNKDYKPVYVRGTETGKGVIEALTALGGKNNCAYNGKDCNRVYFIMPDNYICTVSINSTYGKYIMATAEEIKPLRWRAERNGNYYLVNTTMDSIEVRDYRTPLDDDHYNCGNYFRTREEAQEMAEKIKKVLLPD